MPSIQIQTNPLAVTAGFKTRILKISGRSDFSIEKRYRWEVGMHWFQIIYTSPKPQAIPSSHCGIDEKLLSSTFRDESLPTIVWTFKLRQSCSTRRDPTQLQETQEAETEAACAHVAGTRYNHEVDLLNLSPNLLLSDFCSLLHGYELFNA